MVEVRREGNKSKIEHMYTILKKNGDKRGVDFWINKRKIELVEAFRGHRIIASDRLISLHNKISLSLIQIYVPGYKTPKTKCTWLEKLMFKNV